MACVDPLSKIKAKTFLSRNLAFLLAARWPPTLAPDWCHRLLFCLLFFDRISEGIFFIFAHFWDSLGTPKIIKNRQKSTSEAFLFPSLCISCFFSCFWLILDDFEDAKCVYFIGRADKICILAKNELWQSWGRFWTHFGCFLGAWGSLKWGKVGSRRGSKKTSIFETPFFPTLADFRRSEGAQTLVTLDPFSLLFRSWGLLFLLGAYFCLFWWIFAFLDLFVDEFSWFLDVVFCERRCILWGNILPWIAKVLPETAKILINFFTYINPRVECGGLRFSEQNTNCIRAAPLLSEY